MMILVTGGSGSGKSAFAEETVLSLGEARRIYIATMQAFDEESHRRIRRHRHIDRKSTRLNSSHTDISRMPSSA